MRDEGEKVILIGLGANLDHPLFGPPLETLIAAVTEIEKSFPVVRQSSWYSSAPVPLSDQPWFVNAVISISSDYSLEKTLIFLGNIEKKFGRVRKKKWEARVLDLDILTFDRDVTTNQDQLAGPVVPHPMISQRAFVLAPIAEIAPEWRHPVTELRAEEMLSNLSVHQEFKILAAGSAKE